MKPKRKENKMRIKCSTIISFLRFYMIVYACMFLSGCVVVDFLLGKDPKTISKEIDVNGDGKLSKEEIQASKYDTNKDGILSIEEMSAAMAPHKSTDMALGLLAAFNIPFAGLAMGGLKAARSNKIHIQSIVGGIDDLVEKKQNGITKDELYDSIKDFSKKKNNFAALGKMVKSMKVLIREERKK